MNILFVNYGDFTSNSLNHIGAFANRLTLLGHACVVAVPENPDSLSVVHEPLFTPATFTRALETEPMFPNRRPADVVHAWTPRENVREFTLRYLQRHTSAALVIHLEDNETFLIESYAHEPLEKLRTLSDEELEKRLSPRLSHPVRFRGFLRLAHGISYITDRLREFVPEGTPAHRLLPGVDPSLHRTATEDPALRAELGLAPDERMVVFTGSTTFANLADVRTLLLAIRLINERGTPCKLVRTGINPPTLAHELAALGGPHVIELGFIPKTKLGPLLAAADVLVQPGTADAFNDYRLPSKIPEFLCAGRPTVIPAANIGHEVIDGEHALLLKTGTPEEIAEHCMRIFSDPALAARLSAGAVEFAHTRFDLDLNTRELLDFYARVSSGARPIFSDPLMPASEDVLLAEGDLALRMRAKEQSIAHLRELLSARETDVRRIQAEIAALTERTQAELAALAASTRAQLEARSVHARNEVAAARNEVAAVQLELANAEGMIAALRSAIEDAHAQHAVMRSQSNYQSAKIEAAKNQVEVLRGQLAEAVSTTGHFRRELEAGQAHTRELDGEIRRRDDKIARLMSSFSWQATAPLRALRRALVDPLKRRPKPAPKPRIEIDPGFIYSLDEPTDVSAVSPEGRIRGWILSNARVPIAGVRLRVAGQLIEGRHGVTRPDVAAHHAGHPHALRSGFLIDFALPANSEQTLVLEARIEDGWRAFAAPAVRIAPDVPEHLRRDYGTWVRRFDHLPVDQIVALRARIEALGTAQHPLISIVMPVYNTPERWLTKAIESVRAQIYPHWELCIADDASTEPHVRRTLDDYAARDGRIKVEHRESNGHISAASNSALALAGGEFTALLDHDDELAPIALAEIVFALARDPDLEFIYTDEDKIDEQGRRFDPYFKPDWNPDLLLGQNYTCHLSVFRTDRLKAIGGFRVGYEGSQDWDLTLRATENLAPPRILHIPRILYHWRAIAGSTALVADQKSNYPHESARKALTDHLARTGAAAELVPVPGYHWRIKRPLASPAPKVSIIIPTRNSDSLLRISIGSIVAKTTYPNYEIIVVDNRSDDPATLEYFEELRRMKVRIVDFDAPFNFSAINNVAARAAEGNILAFLNNDLEVISPDWLNEMASQALRPEIGCVGAMLYYPDDTVQHAGAVLGLTGPAGRDGVAGHAFKCARRGSEGQRNRLRLVQNYSAVTAACLVIRREVFEQVGGFNERDLAVAFNDIDFCLRVREAGYWNLWTPFAEFYHHESASRGLEDTPEKVARFQAETAYMRRSWGPLLDDDPAYNPNLSLQHEDFSLAFPPRERLAQAASRAHSR